jgi:carboxymethylenebutenolidase
VTVLVCTWTLGQDNPAAIPPGEPGAKARIESTPRHAEYADISLGEGKGSIRAYVVYPEVSDKAGVVVVIHEIFGLTDWIKAVSDQLAADGFIAIAPDYLSQQGGTEKFASRDEATRAVRAISREDSKAILAAVRDYAAKLPASNGKFGTVGFCWGGSRSFEAAVDEPTLSAAVVYYGTSPAEGFDKISAPVLGLYGSDDARVNATIPPAQEKMKELNKPYTPHLFEGAGHGFLRQQDGRDGANLKASQEAWKLTVQFLREHLK